MIEDDDTFKTKCSRIVVINSLTNRLTNRILETRYKSAKNPFLGIAEMITTLTTVYYNTN